jgi:single-strand DNA-binding protein
MGNVNKVILIGNLGADPELKRTADNRAYCHLRLATNVVWKDKTGQRQEKTDWHRVTVWGDTADHCGRYLSRGRPVYIEGHLENRQWQDKDGQKRYATDVVANRVVFLGDAGGAPAGRGDSVDTVQEDPPSGGTGELFAVG